MLKRTNIPDYAKRINKKLEEMPDPATLDDFALLRMFESNKSNNSVYHYNVEQEMLRRWKSSVIERRQDNGVP